MYNITNKMKKIPAKIINKLFTSKLQEIPFLVLISFFSSFVISRGYIYLTSHDLLADVLEVDYVTINNVHIHHFIWGIIIISICGFISLVNVSRSLHRSLAVFYGIGLGLTFDEFAIWIKLDTNYFSHLTYDSIISISLFLLSVVYFPAFWRNMGKGIKRIFLKR